MFKELVQELDADLETEELEQFEIHPLKESMEVAVHRLSHPELLDGYATGYSKLDGLIGGFAKGELIVIGGGTGQGKTQFAQSLILNLALNNIPVLFFTLEMSRVETTIRFMRMVKSKCDPITLPDLPIYYYGGNGVSLNILEEAIARSVEMGVKAVFIDHLHFFARSVDNQSTEVGNITRKIKLLARKYDVPIILISHIRKMNNPEKRPDLDDLRDSSFIAQDSDFVLMIWRDLTKNDRLLEVYVRKIRNRGNIGMFFLRLDNNYYLEEAHHVLKNY